MNLIEFDGLEFPYTGRSYPEWSDLKIFESKKFLDLCYYDQERDLWIYLSTIKK